MRRKFGNVLVGVLLAAACLAVAACNTVEGVGKDLKAGGQAIENAAN